MGEADPRPARVILGIGAPARDPERLARVLLGLPHPDGLAVVLAVQRREVLDEGALRRALGGRADALAPVVDGAALEAGRIYLPGPDQIVTVQGGRFRTRPAEARPSRSDPSRRERSPAGGKGREGVDGSADERPSAFIPMGSPGGDPGARDDPSREAERRPRSGQQSPDAGEDDGRPAPAGDADGDSRPPGAAKAARESGRATMDGLLASLAQDGDGNTIGLVLAGTGGDGTMGVVAVKEAGGFTIAEADEAAAANGPAALADVVLPADEIPERVALHVRHLGQRHGSLALEEQASQLSGALDQVAAVLRERTGHDFHGYKRPTFLRRVQRRMQVVGAETVEDYLGVLRARPDEAQQLFGDLLIGVTRFFRDPREFEFLEREIVPRLFEGKSRGDQVRVWVLGCSTGEEAYSIAILLREHAATLEAPPAIQIFASDLDGRALTVARAGRYPPSVAQDVTPGRLARWFVEDGDTYAVVRQLREICVFSQHSLIRDTPFSRLDLISCRNLLIYLSTDLQDRMVPLFHFALKPGGYLFLGTSENVSRHSRLFAPVDRGFRVFRKRETERHILPEFPVTTALPHAGDEASAARVQPADRGLVRRAERLAERHAPAYAIVDDRYDVLHFSARAGRYVHPAGAPSLNLLDLVHADLRPYLRDALGRATREGHPARADGLRMEVDEGYAAVDLLVEPVSDGVPGASRRFVVLFKDGPVLPDMDGAAPAPSDARLRRLEAELRATRERLQATIEELESTNEELKASNEEYQSLNEELQSANEELATSKEELQSVNEELTTVNGELSLRVQELDRANSDIKNLLESTQIATVFLDRELRVTNFTPAVAEVFPLVETDLGRPIGHIKPRVAYEALQDDVRRVLRTLGTVEREVEAPASGARYMARVLPYRDVDDVIAGAVATFTDITPLARAQRALRESEERFRGLAGLSPDGILLAADGLIRYANPAAARLLGAASPDAVRDRSALDFVLPEHREALRAQVADAARGRYPPPREVCARRLDGANIALEVVAGPVHWQDEPAAQVLLRDLTERKKAEAHQRLLLAELQHRVRNTLAVVRSIARRTAETSDTVEGYASHFEGRISSFARTQGMVTRSLDASVDLEELVRDELLAHAARDEAQAHVDGPRLRLGPKAAEVLGLAVHELATNAVKYGALSGPGGRVSVVWRVEGTDGGRVLQLVWQESGARPPEVAERRRGFGTELIERTLRYELDAQARLDFTPDGVRCTIAVPLTERVMPGAGATRGAGDGSPNGRAGDIADAPAADRPSPGPNEG